jgi:transcriptional regulator with XRE-family HTH domain
MNKELTFGRWIRERREQLGLTLQVLVERSGVGMATISRIENERSQVMLSTAVRLCETLEATAKDLVLALQGRNDLSGLEQVKSAIYGRNVLTPEDVRVFLRFSTQEPQKGRDLLARLLPKFFDHPDTSEGYYVTGQLEYHARGDIEIDSNTDRLLATLLIVGSSIYQFSLKYPRLMNAETILKIYNQGGMLIPMDVETYIQKIPSKISGAKLDFHLESVLSRIRTGTVERIKLVDVLLLDEKLGKDGEILGMYWSLSKYFDKILHHESGEYGWDYMSDIPGEKIQEYTKLASLLITASRWLQHSNWEETSWLDNLRLELGTSSSSSD